MERLHFSTVIKASPQKVWETMLNDATYLQWTEPFSPGPEYESYIEGDWNEGSSIRFLGRKKDDKDGAVSGMFSRIRENRPYQFLSIEHLGEILEGKETPWPEITPGSGPQENYTFKEVADGTELSIDMDTKEEYKKMFEDMWPKALQKLKEITEKK